MTTRYGDVIVRARTVLAVQGTYNVRSLLVEPDVRIIDTPGLLTINSVGNIIFGDRSGIEGVLIKDLTGIQIYSNGSITVGTGVALEGVLSAPQGAVQFGSRSSLLGCVGGGTARFRAARPVFRRFPVPL